MTLLKIARLGHPVLLAEARPVGNPADPEIQRLARDMVLTMRDANGVGLAAPQVHESLRMIVAQDSAGPDRPERPEPVILVDPVLTPEGDETEEAFEGCLSIPGLRGLVPRWRRVAWRATGLDGEAFGGVAEGFFARVLQHEVDHLDGVLYPMRMRDLRLLTFDSEFAQLQAWRQARQGETA